MRYQDNAEATFGIGGRGLDTSGVGGAVGDAAGCAKRFAGGVGEAAYICADAGALRSAERNVGDHAGYGERSESLGKRWYPTASAKDGLIVKWGGGVCRRPKCRTRMPYWSLPPNEPAAFVVPIVNR